MEQIDRVRLVARILQEVRILADGSDFEAKSAAHQIAETMLNSLALGASEYRIIEPKEVKRMQRLMLGGHADRERPIMIRSIATSLRSAARMLSRHEETAIYIARHLLAPLDARFESADGSVLLKAVQRTAKGSASGAIADLLLATGALDTKPSKNRTALQRSIDKTLRR